MSTFDMDKGTRSIPDDREVVDNEPFGVGYEWRVRENMPLLNSVDD